MRDRQSSKDSISSQRTVTDNLPEYPLVSQRVNHPLIPSVTHKRLANFLKSDYVSQNVSALCDRARADGPEHIKMTRWVVPELGKVSFSKAAAAMEANDGPGLEDLRVKGVFGPPWSVHWVKVDLSIPEEWRHQGRPVHFEFDPSCEALVFSENGRALHGITGSSIAPGPAPLDVRRTEHIIPPVAVEKGEYTIYIEVSCSSPFEVGMFDIGFSNADMSRTFPLLHAHLVLPNLSVRAMCADFRMLRQISQSTENRASDLPRRALKAADDMMNAWKRVPGDKEDPELLEPVVRRCRDIAWRILGPLGEEDRQWLAPSTGRLYPNAKIWAIGHCHIDCAWLWRFTQAQAKVARSWTTQCDLMDRWPNHHFAASSAVQYTWLERMYPDAFARVKHYVREGRFHPVGGSWLEPDCNLPSGESLIRHHLYGQRYFQAKFGIRCREAWLPDTFGYNSQIPQILRGCGIQYFITQKLRYNINPFPYTTFNWAALDGTQVLAHITPADTYKGQCDYKELEKCIWNNKNVADAPSALLLFGNGGAGGGPTPEMLEKLERLSSASFTNGEIPSVRLAKPADFFDHLLRLSDGGETLPTHRGELYLEFHRGTYTTQSEVKMGNRQMERLLRDLEYFGVMASLRNKKYRYPREEIEEIWKDTMLNQFHDVLPGTTISLVVDDVLAIYKRRSTQAQSLIEQAIQAIYPDSSPVKSLTGEVAEVTVLDPLRLDREAELVHLGHSNALSIQAGHSGVGRAITSSGASNGEYRAYQDGDCYILENSDLRLTLSDGRITSLLDVHLDRELIMAGPGAETGGLMAYEDYPLEWDAWDMEVYHLQNYDEIRFDEVEVVGGDMWAGLKATARFGKSIAALTFSLGQGRGNEGQNDRSLVRVDAHIDWHEEHRILKFVLPLDIHSPFASYGTQFGMVQRPTHRNTTHDQARFEVCAHNFADLSEGAYGVAIASAKYGYSVEGNVMRVSLLRSSKSPDPTADMGEHNISWAIMPHLGQMQGSQVYKRAMAFVNPAYLRTGIPLDAAPLPSFTIQGVQAASVVMETIKRAEDSNAVILRIYESLGNRSAGYVHITGVDVKEAHWVNMLEDVVADTMTVAVEDGVQIELKMRAFEIKTLRLVLVE